MLNPEIFYCGGLSFNKGEINYHSKNYLMIIKPQKADRIKIHSPVSVGNTGGTPLLSLYKRAKTSLGIPSGLLDTLGVDI